MLDAVAIQIDRANGAMPTSTAGPPTSKTEATTSLGRPYVTFRDMGAAFGAAILGIYVLVVAQFGRAAADAHARATVKPTAST